MNIIDNIKNLFKKKKKKKLGKVEQVYEHAPDYVGVFCKELVAQFIKNRKRFKIKDNRYPIARKVIYTITDTATDKVFTFELFDVFHTEGFTIRISSPDNIFTKKELEYLYVACSDYLIHLRERKKRIEAVRKKAQMEKNRQELTTLYNLNTK